MTKIMPCLNKQSRMTVQGLEPHFPQRYYNDILFSYLKSNNKKMDLMKTRDD
jgi:hypothetical protein